MSVARVSPGALAVLVVWAVSPPVAFAQSPGRIVGRVLAADGQPAPVARVAAGGDEVTTDEDGTFTIAAIPPGRHVVTARSADGREEGRVSVDVPAGSDARVDVVMQLAFSEDVVVTESRTGRLRHETPASVGSIAAADLALAKPSHPSEILGHVPGVWVSITGGEGHQTAIRQPLTTNPVYLYLEDGVPTRSTGFFNHNALYEINVPGAGGVEVTRGPSSALYGSDAIGGVVNVVTKSAFEGTGIGGTVEAGGDGWRRALLDASLARGTQGLRVTANFTESEGWRAATAYDRQSATLRWDRLQGSALTKTLLSVNRIDQQTAGSSTLPEADFHFDASANLTPISYRDVFAFRLSVDHQRMFGASTLSVVPYYRYDTMELLPNWALTYDPTVYTTSNHSVGLLAKVQHDFVRWRTSLISGLDVDYSPGQRIEDIVRPTMIESGLPSGRGVFASYTLGARIYDYSVDFTALAPYAQIDFSPTDRLRLSAGLRADYMRYGYDDRLTGPDTPRHRRPADGSRSFAHVSPKLGITYQVNDTTSLFGSYRHAFRAPSEGQLFRQGSARNTIDLAPVRADNLEGGVRLTPRRGLSFDVAVYQLDKRDDILSYRDPFDGLTTAVNAGQTRHRGIEAGAHWFALRWGVQAAYAYGRHTYVDWLVDPSAGVDLSGFEQESAPRHIGSASLRVTPVSRLTAAADVMVLGRYWMDANNTTAYGGHTLVNLRGQVELSKGVRTFVKALNLFDRMYAESASYTIARGRELAPGRPRTIFAGVELDWRK